MSQDLISRYGYQYWAVIPEQGCKPEIKIKIKFVSQGDSVSPLKRILRECDSINVRASIEKPTGAFARDAFIDAHQLCCTATVKKAKSVDDQMQEAADALVDMLTRKLYNIKESDEIPANVTPVSVEVRGPTK